MTAKKQPAKTELENLLKRLQADFDNYRKRVEQEKNQITQFANANLIINLLPVLDNFKRSYQHVPQEIQTNSWVTGIQAIEHQFEDILSRLGLTVIAPDKGESFDPRCHEAVATHAGGESSGVIMRTVTPGYKLHGKVLRPAKVEVS